MSPSSFHFPDILLSQLPPFFSSRVPSPCHPSPIYRKLRCYTRQFFLATCNAKLKRANARQVTEEQMINCVCNIPFRNWSRNEELRCELQKKIVLSFSQRCDISCVHVTCKPQLVSQCSRQRCVASPKKKLPRVTSPEVSLLTC